MSISINKITYKKGGKFTANIGNGHGGLEVKLKIGRKTYTEHSNAAGDVSFKVGLKPGTYKGSTISINDNKYQGTKSVDLKIERLKINHKFNTDDFVVKRGGKDLVIKLYDSDGGIDGIKVRYYFSNHGYNYKTTADGGRITFKTSSLKAGTYKFEVVVSSKKYDYTENGKNRYVTVKK